MDLETSFSRRTLEDTVSTMLRHHYFGNTRVKVGEDQEEGKEVNHHGNLGLGLELKARVMITMEML